jgi:RimJ/RimL family protein N-acetyltransferase
MTLDNQIAGPTLFLSGNGVVLEPLGLHHAQPLVAAAADGNLSALEITVVPGQDTVGDYIEKALAGFKAGTVLPFAIALADTGAIVGSTRFWKMDSGNRRLEIGSTWIAKSRQGGFVNPAIKYLMLRYAFETMDCVRVQFQTDVNNARSRAAILRLGAVEEGIVRHERIMPNGRKRDSFRFSIIDSEWLAAKARLEDRLRALGIEPSYLAEG